MVSLVSFLSVIFNRRSSSAMVSVLILSTLLTGCLESTESETTNFVRLAPCTVEGSLFADIAFDQWKNRYDTTVSSVIEAHLGSSKDVSQAPLKCTAEDYASALQPSSALRSLAQTLPAWQDQDALSKLSEADMGAVLLEFLRVYECSLLERNSKLTNTIINESSNGIDVGELNDRRLEQRKSILREMEVARRTLNRAMELVGGYDRFRPLAVDIECLKRTSLDLRNVLGLASEAGSCMPRILDAHQSLRDPPQP